MSRNFRLLVFLRISFPQASEYNITAISNFFANGKKSSSRKILIILFGHLWVVESTYIFAFKFTLRYLQPDIAPTICHRCQQHKRNWWQYLPPVSLIPAAILPPVSLTPVANLPPVSLTSVVNLDWRISPRIFEKIRNDPHVIFRGLGEGDSGKKTRSKKSRDTVPLNR